MAEMSKERLEEIRGLSSNTTLPDLISELIAEIDHQRTKCKIVSKEAEDIDYRKLARVIIESNKGTNAFQELLEGVNSSQFQSEEFLEADHWEGFSEDVFDMLRWTLGVEEIFKRCLTPNLRYRLRSSNTPEDQFRFPQSSITRVQQMPDGSILATAQMVVDIRVLQPGEIADTIKALKRMKRLNERTVHAAT